MPVLLTETQLARARDLIYRTGRLLERSLFAFFFDSGSLEACLHALAAYRNPDGGFGNGIEPDLLCPHSTAIGAETAMFVLDLLGASATPLSDGLVDWITTSLNDRGTIDHPPEGALRYPHQPWWEKADDQRILALAGFLRRWGLGSEAFFAKVRGYYESLEMPASLAFYDYPYYVYLRSCARDQRDQDRLAQLREMVLAMVAKYADHHPLFGRGWFHALGDCPRNLVTAEARRFAEALQPDGGIENPYPQFPCWRPIFTLDGLILLRKHGFL